MKIIFAPRVTYQEVKQYGIQSLNFFLDFCIKEVDDGHRPTTYLDKVGYVNLITIMKKATGRDYTRPQLKNKWDGLKNEWKLWKQLKGKETGLGWNIKKNTIDATEDWWNSKLQVHYNLVKYLYETRRLFFFINVTYN